MEQRGSLIRAGIRSGSVELSTYFTERRILGRTFKRYLKVHEVALSLWDANTEKYRSEKFVSETNDYCVVYLRKAGFYVKWRKFPQLLSDAKVLVGKPRFDGKTWKISCFEPSESLLDDISELWNSEKRRFRNSIFLKRDGKMVWVHLADLKICVGWIKGLGSKIFETEKEVDKRPTEKSYGSYTFGIELRRKINNSYGCW